MTTRHFALVAGLAFLLVGALGFVPGALAPAPAGAPDVRLDSAYGYLLGLFPVNVAHSLVHVAIGLWGVVAFRRATMARSFARSLAVVYGALAIMGLLPALNTVFGFVPIHGHDVWLHAATAIAAAYFGFRRADVAVTRQGLRRAA